MGDYFFTVVHYTRKLNWKSVVLSNDKLLIFVLKLAGSNFDEFLSAVLFFETKKPKWKCTMSEP